jgi:hypothetical protein
MRSAKLQQSEETRQKLSKAKLGKKRGPMSEENKLKISFAQKKQYLAKKIANLVAKG